VAIRNNEVVSDGELGLPGRLIGESGSYYRPRTSADAIGGELTASDQVEDVAADPGEAAR
jgi:hypothetical protein